MKIRIDRIHIVQAVLGVEAFLLARWAIAQPGSWQGGKEFVAGVAIYHVVLIATLQGLREYVQEMAQRLDRNERGEPSPNDDEDDDDDHGEGEPLPASA